MLATLTPEEVFVSRSIDLSLLTPDDVRLHCSHASSIHQVLRRTITPTAQGQRTPTQRRGLDSRRTIDR